MKFKKILLSIMSLVTLLTGCKNDSVSNKINFSIGDKTITDFIDIQNDKIETMIEEKESFILYVHSFGCGSCADITPRVKAIIEDYGITIYRIQYWELADGSPFKLSTGTPILGFYKNGVKLKIIGYSEKNHEQFSSKENLLKLFEKYVIMPENIYYISLEELKRLKKEKQSFVILFSRAGCGDCAYLNQNFFKDYALKNRSKHIYLLECDAVGIRFNEQGEVDTELWNNFKDEWELTEASNPTHGYGVGYVPTFQYYENGVLTASDVYLNDTFESTALSDIKENSNVKYKITITNSFFDDFINTTFETTIKYSSESIQRELYLKYRELSLEFHNQKLENFLNLYTK